MKVFWTRPALVDLDVIGAYLAEHSPRAARQVVAGIEAATDNLALFPETGRPGRVAGTRELVTSPSPYIIPYRLARGRVEILAVFHARQIWPDRFD